MTQVGVGKAVQFRCQKRRLASENGYQYKEVSTTGKTSNNTPSRSI